MRRRPRSSRFVPRLVFSTAFVGVVPACVVAACGSDENTSNQPDVQAYGVAALAYQGYDQLSVADLGYGDGRSDSAADATPDAPADGKTDGDGSG